jgi:hypothetical protein
MDIQVKKSKETRNIIKLICTCECGYTIVREYLDPELAIADKSFLKKVETCIACQEANKVRHSSMKR